MALVHRSIHWLFFDTWNTYPTGGHRREKTHGFVAPIERTTVWLMAVSATVETGRRVSEYLIPLQDAEVAQSVEHMTENHGVGSSILPLGTTFCSDDGRSSDRPLLSDARGIQNI